MITAAQMCEIVEKQKLPYIRIEDMKGKTLYSIEDSSSASNTSALLAEALGYFKDYGTVNVKAANQTEFNAHYRGANQYIVRVSENVQRTGAVAIVPNSQDPIDSFTKMMQAVTLFNTMTGVNRNGDAELEKLKLQFELDRQRREWAKLDEEPFKKYIAAAPLIMSAMGMKQEVINSTLQQMANTDAMFNKPGQQQLTMAGAEKTITLETDAPTKFEDLQNISPEEKNSRIQQLLDKVAAKVSAEEMIMILETIEMQPALLPDYVRLFNISKKVPIEIITKLLKGVELKPEFASAALMYLPQQNS